MILFPAIDIRDGKCVRLIQGNYDKEIIYGDSPTRMALEWQEKGAEFIHIVDLDGAKTGDSLNKNAIQAIAEAVSIPIQVGGGVRTMDMIDGHIESGVDRVIIGTAAITNPSFLKEAVNKYGDKIAVSIDARGGMVATDGWTETTDTKAIDLLKELEEIGVKTVVYTDILKDGMMQGPNFEELKAIDEACAIDIIASGGISTAENIKNLRIMDLYGAIIGKALYDGNLALEDLMETDRLAKRRIIPCLDVDKGKVVKGQKFKNIKEVADPIDLAKKYVAAGADELVFYDITAYNEKRTVFTETIKKIAAEVSIPFTVGGGIRSLDDIQQVLDAGADKVSINSAAIENPEFIKQAADKFGRERIVLGIDVKKIAPSKWSIFNKGGQQDTGLDAIEWAVRCAELGAGEIVVNSIDGDGEKNGYDLELTRAISEAVSIPIVASGGAGTKEHFYEALTKGKASAALGASVFHFDEIKMNDLKEFLNLKID